MTTSKEMQVVNSKALSQGAAIVLAYTLMGPLVEDMEDTFGNAFMYHPVVLWICIATLVYTQTSSWTTGIVVVVGYEMIKQVWRQMRPEPPYIGQVRKLLHRLRHQHDNKSPTTLSDNDIQFLDKITPKDIQIKRK